VYVRDGVCVCVCAYQCIEVCWRVDFCIVRVRVRVRVHVCMCVCACVYVVRGGWKRGVEGAGGRRLRDCPLFVTTRAGDFLGL